MRWVACFVIVLCLAPSAQAQNWSFDARKIALGDAGGADHPASRMIDEERPYKAIVLPFGLIQVLRDHHVFDPRSPQFDIVRSIEYAAAPLHHVIGRNSGTSETGRRLSVDIRNATLSRDLNAYRGFAPRQQPAAEGLTHTSYGATLPIVRLPGGGFHGVYVGAGPYFSMRTAADIDPDLIDILASDVDVYRPNDRFNIAIFSRDQMAAALTGGYRGRYTVPALTGERDGIYVGLDYNVLLGFRYEDFDTVLRLDTDSQGLLTFNPSAGLPLVFERDHASRGRGRAIDVGVGLVADRVEVGFGVKGIANRLTWTGVERTTHSLASLFTGGAFVESPDVPVADATVELPRDYRAYAGYRIAPGMFVADFGRGFQGTSFHGGYEHHLGAIDLRGGALYARETWQPTGGIGLTMGPRVSLDVAMYGTSANVERQRKAAIAVSLRFTQQPALP
jgi:hypothetical protein